MKSDPAMQRPERPTIDDLYQDHGDYVSRILIACGVAARHLADALHDVFVIVIRRWPAYEERGRAREWLAAIARHVAAQYRRSDGMNPVTRDESHVEFADDAPGPDSLAAARQQRELAQRLLAALKPERREILVRRYGDGDELAKIAQELGIPKGTAASRLRLAERDFRAAARRDEAVEQFMSRRKQRKLRGVGPVVDVLDLLRHQPERRASDTPYEGSSKPGHAGPRPEGAIASRAILSAGMLGLVGVLGVAVGAVWQPLNRHGKEPVDARPEPIAAIEQPAPPLDVTVPTVPVSSLAQTATSATPQLQRAAASSPPSPATLSAPSPAPAAVDIKAQRALLDKAAGALARGDADAAAAMLSTPQDRSSPAHLGEEREALLIQALLQAHRRSEAQQHLASFARRFPHSAYVPSLRSQAATMP